MDKDLVSYIGAIVDLEKSVYTQTQSIEKLQEKIDSMGVPVNYRCPNQPNHAGMDLDFESVWGGLVIGGVAGGIIGIFLGDVVGIAMMGGIGLPLFLIITSLISSGSENGRRRKNYKNAVAQYQDAVAKDRIRVHRENEQKVKLQQMLQFMKNKRNETTAVLERYYSLNIVYHKYRNMVAMCSIYEYLMAGICKELTGYDGAYNKYDHDSMLGIIISKLDQVIDNLEQIKNNQYMLFDAIQEGNRISQQILTASVRQAQLQEQTARNTELAAYYQQQQACEANQMKNLMLYDSWNRNREK